MIIFQNLFLVVKSILFLALAVFGVGFIIGFHELGHLIFCKIFKVAAPTYSIGMGPKLLNKKIGTTNYILSAIPLGGYVEMAGEKKDVPKGEHLFSSRSYYQKICIMAGGISFNILFTFLCFSFLYMVGIPKHPILHDIKFGNIIKQVLPKTPASQAGIKKGDQILQIGREKIGNNLIDIIAAQPDKEVTLYIKRGDEEITIPVKLSSQNIDGKNIGILGVQPDLIDENTMKPMSIFKAFAWGAHSTYRALTAYGALVKNMFHKKSIDSVGGPIMVFSQTMKSAEKGWLYFLFMLAFLSVGLAALNILPLPILDGGQILILSIEAIIRHSLSEVIKEYIFITSWIGFLLLTIYITFKDILNIFW
ncbi:MAG: Site-2 protease [candidate division TM6 bacterium GW2011_GWF2_32_72]|nr:MAG: Site-2 protease [candidate division TM6 bacterium GW2011_GWF2_32_72]